MATHIEEAYSEREQKDDGESDEPTFAFDTWGRHDALQPSAAITLFLHQSIIQYGLPFQVREAGFVSDPADADEAVKDMLRAASRYARCHSERLTHRQVFGGLQEIIDGSRVRA